MVHTMEVEIGGRILYVETGKVAKQANGSAIIRYGDTVILATAVAAEEPDEERDFFPLLIEYREKAYAAGKIPGGFFKREGRPREKETVSARLVDRPIRPLFPKEFKNEVQVVITVLSSDQENDADILGIIGASTALSISNIPFDGPIGAVRVGKLGGDFVLNPTFSQLEESSLNVVVAGTDENVIMVEGGAREVSEEDMLEAIKYGHEALRQIIAIQDQLVHECGQEKRPVPPQEQDENLIKRVEDLTRPTIRQINQITEKEERQAALKELVESVMAQLSEEYPEQERLITSIIAEVERDDMRQMILREQKRTDGRSLDEIRPISCEVAVLPRTHGSALFTRGQTQSLAVTTLGTKMDEQRIDDLEGESWKSYMLHYNFPPFSVGEVRPFRGPGRREIGHGALAERAIEPIIPSDEFFPYTIRIVSDILESNGSSSMATVCGGTLSLMDAGVPIKAPVAGIAMGLIKDEDQVAILTDILGVEDHLGDMDFKVTGTNAGITAFQMDVKISGVSYEILAEALERAKKARLHVLDVMLQTIPKPREELSAYAPRIIAFKVDREKIGDIIGPGGKTIRRITEETGVTIDIEDDGKVLIAAVDPAAGERAREMIEALVQEPEIGRIYKGTVQRIMNFGAFVEILPKQDGLLHISEIDHKRTNRVEDVLHVGDEVMVKVIEVDSQGKIKLSRRALLPKPESPQGERPARDRPGQKRR